MKDDDDIDEENPYDFLRVLGDEDCFYLSTDPMNPNVFIQLENDQFFMWSPNGLFHLTLTPVKIDE